MASSAENKNAPADPSAVARALLIAVFFVGTFCVLAWPQISHGAAATAGGAPVAYAFANASPILVFDEPSLKDGHNAPLEFGRAYEVFEQTSDYTEIKLENGTFVYVHSAHVTTVTTPRWLSTTLGYNKSDRELIRFWESATRLKEFLTSANTAGSRWDYEEILDGAPQFQLELPIISSESLKQSGHGASTKVASVMIPIMRETRQAFEMARSSFDRKLDLYFLLDVSGSTDNFLEEVTRAVARGLADNDQLRNRVNSIVVTTFGASRDEKSSFVGKVTISEFASHIWHRPGIGRAGSDDREPLIDGLLTMGRGVLSTSDGIPVIIILSGADVELTSSNQGQSRLLTVESLNLNFPRSVAAIFAQITPEPGTDLQTASEKFSVSSRPKYLGYSDLLADDIVASLLRASQQQEDKLVVSDSLAAVAKAAHADKTMAFVPRLLTSGSNLPAQEQCGAKADWCAIRLWLAIDELIWAETSDRTTRR